MVNRPNVHDFQLNSTTVRPHMYYGLKDNATALIHTPCNDYCPQTKRASSDNNDEVDQTIGDTFYRPSQSLLTTTDSIQQHHSNDISVLIDNAASVSGFSPEVCKHILVEFTRIKRQRMQVPTGSLIKHQRSHLSTIRGSQFFFNLLTLPPILCYAINRLGTILLDVFLYGQILHI